MKWSKFNWIKYFYEGLKWLICEGWNYTNKTLPSVHGGKQKLLCETTPNLKLIEKKT